MPAQGSLAGTAAGEPNAGPAPATDEAGTEGAGIAPFVGRFASG
jgi:hypothetical protein